VEARVHYDSVIYFTSRVIRDHPRSSQASRAALLKARAEIARARWRSAAETAAQVPALTSDESLIGVAAGLEGIARRELGAGADVGRAEALLTRALESGPSSADSATFLFQRGLARLDAGEMEAAAADLEAVGAHGELDPEVRLDLARGLRKASRYGEALRLTSDLLTEGRYADLGMALDSHLDSLALRAPEGLEEELGRLLEDADLSTTSQTLLHFYRGRSRETLGDTSGAMAEYENAEKTSDRGRYGAEAGFRWALLRLRTAEHPDDIIGTKQKLLTGQNVPEAAVSVRAVELSREVGEFSNLVDAVESRGATAAEAALRAAEIAGFSLGARRVARGLYVRYLSLAPDSPWKGKAIAGALALAAADDGGTPDADDATDLRLREELSRLPADDPYRVSVQDLTRSPVIDSAYVEAERNLRRRIVEIRMLYDTTAVLVRPSDTTQAEVQEPTNEEAPNRDLEP
jgi:tetratricopeptide (TPR) repeat protein